jgi:hypothetical protein
MMHVASSRRSDGVGCGAVEVKRKYPSLAIISCCGFVTEFESRGAHGCREQWNMRDTRV